MEPSVEKKFKAARAGVSGFSLIEMLSIVAIIAVLVIIVIIAFGNATQDARDNTIVFQEQILNTAFQAYTAAGGVVSPSASSTDVVAALKSSTSLAAGIQGPFLHTDVDMTMEDGTGTPLNLVFTGNQFNYQ